MDSQFSLSKKATVSLQLLSDEKIDNILELVASALERNSEAIILANKLDLALMVEGNPLYDRLYLDLERILTIANEMRNVAKLPFPCGKIIHEKVLDNGLQLEKISVPFGVVGVIYEARPNVTADVFSLCFKSRNVCLLKGGTDAANSNAAIVSTIRQVLQEEGIDENIITLLPAEREWVLKLLHAVNFVDVIIPRGGRELINYVRDHSKVPLIETGAGVVHVYFDEFGALDKAVRIIENAKLRRVSVCNALDCLLVHISRVNEIYELVSSLEKFGVILEVDAKTYNILAKKYDDKLLKSATYESYGKEFLSATMAIKVVVSIEEAMLHIEHYGSRHSESIITENSANAQLFCKLVDAAVVYVNASTAFTDGAQFGLGAEIGISTQKLHARGPMGLEELTSYKWIVRGDGHIR